MEDIKKNLELLMSQQKKALEVISNSQEILDSSFGAALSSDKIGDSDKKKLLALKKQSLDLIKNAKSGKDINKQIEVLKKQWAYKA